MIIILNYGTLAFDFNITILVQWFFIVDTALLSRYEQYLQSVDISCNELWTVNIRRIIVIIHSFDKHCELAVHKVTKLKLECDHKTTIDLGEKNKSSTVINDRYYYNSSSHFLSLSPLTRYTTLLRRGRYYSWNRVF